ncbi:hypothetical protein EV122DRAFT_281326 [Schizophyllum commune]
MPQLYVPPACVAAVSESNRFVTDSYHPAQSVQPPTSCADGLKAPKPKRPNEDVPKIIVEDEVTDIVVGDCDSSDAQPPGAGLTSPATNSSDGTHLHPHWHERAVSPSEGLLSPNPSNDSPVTGPSEATPSASDAATAAGTSTASNAPEVSTAPDVSTAPALTARPVSSPPVMAAVVVHMFPFSPLVPQVSLGSLRMPVGSLRTAGSFETQLPLGFIPGALSPWVVDGRGLSLQPSPAQGAASLAAGDSKLTLNNEPLPPYSPAPSMGSVTSHWDGERLVSADQGGQRLVGDPWGHEDAVRRWVEELDEFCRTERCASKAWWPTLAEVSEVKGDEAAKANDAAKAKVDHAETVQLDDHTDLLDRIPWPVLRDPDPSSLNTARSNLHDPRSSPPDLARSVTALSVNLFFRAARQMMLDDRAASRDTLNDRTAWPATLEDHAASRDMPDDSAWCALLRKSHRAFRRAREVVEERLREAGRMMKNVKEVHWKDEVEDTKVDSADEDEVVVYMTGDDKRDESAKDGRDDDEEQNLKRQNLEDATPQKLEDTLRAINVVLQTLDVLRRLDGY